MSYPKQNTLVFMFPFEPLAYSSQPSYPGPPYAASNLGILGSDSIVIDRYLMHSGSWMLPDSTATGVPNRSYGGGVVVGGYRCENCKRFFIAAELLDFEHGCRKEDFRP